MAGYNNPIVQAVLGNQQQERANKQFEASLGLQIAQFAENKANATKDQDYRKSVLGEQKRATGVIETANAAKVVEDQVRYDDLLGQRAATQANTEASAAYTGAQAIKVQSDNQNALLKNEGGLWFQHMMNPDGTDKALDTPEAQEYFGAIINQPGLSKLLLSGSDGTQYKFKGIVDAGNGRRAIQIMDPNNPDKVMYMSKDRTAVESDPLTSMDLMSFDILKSSVSIALRNAGERPLSADLIAAANGMNAIKGAPQGSPILLDNQTIQQSAELSEQMQVQQSAAPVPAAPPKDQKVGVAEALMSADQDLSAYSWDELNSLTDNQWSTALEGSEKRLQTMRQQAPNIERLIERNKKTMASVQKQIDKVDGEVPDGLVGQMQLLTNNAKRLSDRKGAGNDTFDSAQLAHNNLLDAKEVADGKKPAPTAKVKAAANIVKKAEIDPRQSKDPDLAAAVEKEIVANPPPVAQVAQALGTPQKITPGLLYQLHTAKALGLIDQTSLQTALDLGVFSQSAVDLMKQQMIEQTKSDNNTQDNKIKILTEAMKNEANAAKPKYNELNDGTLQALSSTTGEVLWQSGADNTEGRDQTAIRLVVDEHNDQGKNGKDPEESATALAQQMNAGPLPKLEANLLAQNLNQVLYDKLGVNMFDSPIDWFNGSDEDGEFGTNKYAAHNPMDNVTLRFALNPNTGKITMYDQYGIPHGDRDYNLTDLNNDALQKALGGILQSPAEVEKRLIPKTISKLEAELASRQAALGIN